MSEQKKILHLVSADGNWEPFVRVTSLAAALREHGFATAVAAPNHSRLWELAEGAGVEVVAYTLERSINPLRWKEMATMIAGTGADIVHVHDPDSATLLSRAGMFMDKTDIVTSRYELQTPIAGAEYGGKVKAVACPSQTIADGFAKSGAPADKIHVVPGGVNMAMAERSEEERAAIRAFFRDTYCPEKEKPLFLVNMAPLDDVGSHRELLEAMPEILAALPQTHLFIMGEGPQLEELKRQRKITALKGDVTFLEPDKAFHRLLAAADIYVSWSRNDASGLMVQTAMAAGRSVVLRNSGCYGELIENGKSGIFAAEGVDNLRDALLALLESRPRREKLGKQAKARAARLFDMKELAGKMAKIYRTLS